MKTSSSPLYIPSYLPQPKGSPRAYGLIPAPLPQVNAGVAGPQGWADGTPLTSLSLPTYQPRVAAMSYQHRIQSRRSVWLVVNLKHLENSVPQPNVLHILHASNLLNCPAESSTFMGWLQMAKTAHFLHSLYSTVYLSIVIFTLEILQVRLQTTAIKQRLQERSHLNFLVSCNLRFSVYCSPLLCMNDMFAKVPALIKKYFIAKKKC